MAQLYADDICSFKSDPSIIGTVEQTWRDVDGDYIDNTDCYFHKDTPEAVRHDFLVDLRPPSGYVVVGFEQPYDFCCLVSEASLDLLDRALSTGDVVKRHLSDAESGTVISSALSCSLRPLCTADRYNVKHFDTAHGVLSKTAAEAQPASSSDSSHRVQQLTNVPAKDLKYWNQYREDDYIIYRDWIGQVREVVDEVTVRLSNGSVVVVQNSLELDEPYWMPGSQSSELHRSLVQLKYELHHTTKSQKPGKSWSVDHCYPGQLVETKKGNLRRGVWKFGAYNPNVEPKGLVVDVRTVQIEVFWYYPNLFKPYRTQKIPPPVILEGDVLQNGAVTVYDRSRQPQITGSSQLSEASYSPDVGLGHRVRFRDAREAAIKYGDFNHIPRAATQGYDMNVLQVAKINTRVIVQWQDASITTEDSVALVPYDNVDDHDVWPGTCVSLKAEEIDQKGKNVTTCRKIGVVQAADAAERVARIRWFSKSIATIPRWNPFESVQPTRFGQISDDYSEVSLYDVVPYPALSRSRGDLLIIIPDFLPRYETVDAVQDAQYREIVSDAYENLSEDPDDPPVLEYTPARTRRDAFGAPSDSSNESDESASDSLDIDWFGEVLDLRLDGNMTVRLGAAQEVRDITLPFERVVLITGDDGEDSDSDVDDSDEDSNETWEGESDTDDESDGASDIILSYDITYTGGRRLDDGTDDELWSTEEDEDMPDLIDLSPSGGDNRRSSDSDDEMPALVPLSPSIGREEQALKDEGMPDLEEISKPSKSDRLNESDETTSSPIRASKSDHPMDSSASLESIPTSTSIKPISNQQSVMPPQFAILQETPPTDHHYISKSPSTTSAKMRRIIKEHQIMQSSLPEGVFVRTWEDRLDILRVLIIGPRETPYELAPFLIDFYFGDDFPTKPPKAYFHSWTNGVGRVNPNLYEDGNICLSLLGTWPGDDGKDTWSATGSTMLQIIVSILGLVLVKEPYYNEAGFEVLAGTSDTSTNSAQYTERAFVLSRGFVQALLDKRPGGISDITQWTYLSKNGPQLLQTNIQEAKALLPANSKKPHAAGSSGGPLGHGNGSKKLSRGAAMLLERTVQWLEGYAVRIYGEIS